MRALGSALTTELLRVAATKNTTGDCAICRKKIEFDYAIRLLVCRHMYCKACLMRYAAQRLMNYNPFSCPLCRSTAAGITSATWVNPDQPLSGVPTSGAHSIFGVADVYQNWHIYAVRHDDTDAYFVNNVLVDCNALTTEEVSPQDAYTRCSTCWWDPKVGKTCALAPSENPLFNVVNV